MNVFAESSVALFLSSVENLAMKTIYVVEDHEVIRTGVVQYLSLSGYEALGYKNIAEAKSGFEKKVPDLLIQDVMLPDGDGFSFVKEIKSKHEMLPVIFLTARIDESDRILGFELGADDYVTKPFSPKELVLRIQALFRRLEQGAGEKASKAFVYKDEDNELRIDDEVHELTVNGEIVNLTAAEWRIIFYLISNAPNLITRAQILEECFDYSFDSYERVVDTHIKNIRTKLRHGNWIDTVRGYGYRFSGKRV